ncbi:MAG: hypothetical protein Q7S57_01960 [bacterium]|nr:hypothetical protein [bacterium]
MAEFKVWQTITMGVGWCGDSFFMENSRSYSDRVDLTPEADEMVSKLRGVTENLTLDLFLLRPGQFGIESNSSIDQILTAAVQAGLESCPRELAPYLLIKDKVAYGETFLVGMRPIFIRRGSTSCVSTFYVNRPYRRLEHRCCCEGQVFCERYSTWLFVMTRKA